MGYLAALLLLLLSDSARRVRSQLETQTGVRALQADKPRRGDTAEIGGSPVRCSPCKPPLPPAAPRRPAVHLWHRPAQLPMLPSLRFQISPPWAATWKGLRGAGVLPWNGAAPGTPLAGGDLALPHHSCRTRAVATVGAIAVPVSCRPPCACSCGSTAAARQAATVGGCGGGAATAASCWTRRKWCLPRTAAATCGCTSSTGRCVPCASSPHSACSPPPSLHVADTPPRPAPASVPRRRSCLPPRFCSRLSGGAGGGMAARAHSCWCTI
jgi:hypothetical protein